MSIYEGFESFGDLLKYLLRQKGWSQGKLASKMNCNRGYVSKLIRNKIREPRNSTLNRIYEIFQSDLVDSQFISPENLTKINSFDNEKYRVADNFNPDVNQFENLISQQNLECNAKIDELSKYIESPLILITGIKGTGKSITAEKFLAFAKHNFQKSLFMKASSDASVIDIAEYIGFCLGCENSNSPIRDIVTMIQKYRCLIVLDNLDLENQEYGGSYHQLLERIAETPHQSCVIVTCRSLPKGYGAWEPNPHVIRLKGLSESEAISFLENLGIPPKSDPELLKALFNKYGGNPLGLKLAVQDILEKFRGDLAAYLKHSTLFAGNLHDEIQSIVDRLSSLELEILYWLALQREAIYFGDILEEFPDRYKTSSRSTEIEKAVRELDRRSLLQSHDGEYHLQTEVQTFTEINFLNAIQSELEELAADGNVDSLHWLRALNLSDEKIKLRDRLLRRDPELVAEAHKKIGEDFQHYPEKTIGHAIANFRYLLKI